MGKMFDIIALDNAARAGVIRLGHGELPTPAFMPVATRGVLKTQPWSTLEGEGLDFPMILMNTWHLIDRPGATLIREAGGLHRFTTWTKNILTDSGGFQVWSLDGKVKKDGVELRGFDGRKVLLTPELSVSSQATFGSDIMMALDVCTPWGASVDKVREALDTTKDWCKKSLSQYIREIDKRKSCDTALPLLGHLAPIVQGGFSEDLRREAAEWVGELCLKSSLDFPVVAIGGVSVGEPKEEFSRIVRFTAPLINPSSARYVMGVGTPGYLLEMIEAGCDIADCVLPTREARHGKFFSKDGPVVIKQARYEKDFSPIDKKCTCPVCKRYSRAYLHHLHRTGDDGVLGTVHNLSFLKSLMAEAREAIIKGVFSKYKADFLSAYYGGGEG